MKAVSLDQSLPRAGHGGDQMSQMVTPKTKRRALRLRKPAPAAPEPTPQAAKGSKTLRLRTP